MSLADPFSPETAAPRRWLSIVGIGEDGVEGLSPVARGLISSAEIVFGGKRHLALASSLIRGASRPWPSPFERAVDEVKAHRGRQVCVLASGDPFHYGVGSVLARQIEPQEMLVVPAPARSVPAQPLRQATAGASAVTPRQAPVAAGRSPWATAGPQAEPRQQAKPRPSAATSQPGPARRPPPAFAASFSRSKR